MFAISAQRFSVNKTIDAIVSFGALTQWIGKLGDPCEKEQILAHLKDSMKNFINNPSNKTITKHLSMLHTSINDNLPKEILAHTLSFLSDKQKFRLFVVSKEFYRLIEIAFGQFSEPPN